MCDVIIRLYQGIFKGVDQLQSVFALLLRAWIAQVFFYVWADKNSKLADHVDVV